MGDDKNWMNSFLCKFSLNFKNLCSKNFPRENFKKILLHKKNRLDKNVIKIN